MDISLGKRLQLLARIILTHHSKTPYLQAWDCCCDHGLLGRYLLSRNIAERVNFVDCVTDIMAKLPPLLAGVDESRYRLLTQDAATIQLETGRHQLVIIAGIGGELATNLLRTIVNANPDASVDFLLCPNNSIYELRNYLAAGNFSLLHEQLINERKWFYEAILVRNNGQGTPVSPTGEFWETGNKAHATYLSKLTSHLSSLQKGDEGERAAAYLEKLNRLSEAVI